MIKKLMCWWYGCDWGDVEITYVGHGDDNLPRYEDWYKCKRCYKIRDPYE